MILYHISPPRSHTLYSYSNGTTLILVGFRFGDCIDPAPYPVFSKARKIGDTNAILLPLNDERHFGESYQRMLDEELALDFPFWDKIPKVRL